MNDLSIIYKFKFQNPELNHLDYLEFEKYFYFQYKNDSKFPLPAEPSKPVRMKISDHEDIIKFLAGVDISLERKEEIEALKNQYENDMLEWENNCISNKYWRHNVKLIYIGEIINLIRNIKSNRDGTPDHGSYQYSKYGNYKKKLIDNYIEIWENSDTDLESLENLILYYKILFLCIDENMIKKHKIDYTPDDYYSREDSYNDGGGGDEWSDPSEFW